MRLDENKEKNQEEPKKKYGEMVVTDYGDAAKLTRQSSDTSK